MSDSRLLEEKVDHPSPNREKVAGWRVFSALVVPPLTYSTQVIVSFGVASEKCTGGAAVLPALLIVNLAGIAILFLILGLSILNARLVAGEDNATSKEFHDQGDGRTSFLVQFGLLMSAIFAVASLVEFLAIIFLGTCAGYSPSL